MSVNTTNSPEAQAQGGETPVDFKWPKQTLAAMNVPRATGETTVESALDELREMFPGKAILIRREDSFYPPDCRDSAETNSMVQIKIGYLESEPKFRSFRSLADCMAQVRAATRTEGGEQ